MSQGPGRAAATGRGADGRGRAEVARNAAANRAAATTTPVRARRERPRIGTSGNWLGTATNTALSWAGGPGLVDGFGWSRSTGDRRRGQGPGGRMLHLPFTAEDVARTRFAPAPAPMLELTAALATLQRRDPLFGPWRHRTARVLPRAVNP